MKTLSQDDASKVAGREFPEECALGDNFLQCGTLLSMGIRFSKTTANTVAYPPGGRYEQNSIWPPPEQYYVPYRFFFWQCITTFFIIKGGFFIPLFLCF